MDLAIFVFENASERRLCSSGYAPQIAMVISDTSVDTRAPYWQSSCCTTRPDMVCGAGANPALAMYVEWCHCNAASMCGTGQG